MTSRQLAFLTALLCAGLSSCGGTPPKPEPKAEQTSTAEVAPEPSPAQPESAPASGTSAPASAAVQARVERARKRLEASDPGKLIWGAIEAHGGLERWFSSGALKFRFDYRPLKKRPPNDTRQLVDVWASRAVHEVVQSDESVGPRFGWDGQRAWIEPAGTKPPTNVRFWSLTPYYFVGIPFVLGDEGAILTAEGSATLEGRPYDLVRASFGPGVGDAPGDYYVVYIDRETKRVGAARYIVSYPGFFKDGGHSAEKLMTYDGEQRIGGVLFPKTHRTFKVWEPEPSELVTEVTVSEVEWIAEVEANAFDVPAGAETLEGW